MGLLYVWQHANFFASTPLFGGWNSSDAKMLEGVVTGSFCKETGVLTCVLQRDRSTELCYALS